MADQVAVNYLKADITQRQREMLDFAMQVSQNSASVTDETLDAMREKGFADDDIWDIAAIAAFFAMSNRLANVSGMRPNDEFYLLGREPR